MPRKPPAIELTENELHGINKSFEALNTALDELEESVQRNAVDHAAIKTKLDNVLFQLKGLAKTVSGDQGLVSRVSVLESKLKAAEADVERKAKEIRDELNREIDALKASVEEIRKAQQDDVKQELQEVKGQQKEGKNHRLSLWGAAISTLALLVTIALFSLQNCSPTSAKAATKAAPATAVKAK